MSEQYVDFDLHIGPSGHATANSPQGEATADISIEIPSNIRLSLRLIERRAADADLLKDVGLELYKWLFPGPIHTHFHQTEAVARTENTKMRLRLRVEAEEIASLPLEFIYRETGGYFIAINPDTVLSRYLSMPMPPGYVRRREGPLHMITIIADPTDQTRLPPDEWESIIEEALAEPLENGQMTLRTIKRATRKEIRDALLQQEPDIIQFVGHGIYRDGKGYLALVDEDTHRTWLVDDEQFANLYLGHDDHLGLVSLATCQSAKSDDPQGFSGIAPKLVQRGVPAVLAMQYEVYIETAKVFLEDFYTSVAARKPIDWATQSARNAISLEIGLDNREFATPVLYMRAKDGDVFRTVSSTSGSLEDALRKAKARALEAAAALEDRELVKPTRERIRQAGSADQVREAMAMAVELNVSRVVERLQEAIRQKRKCYVRYRPDPEGPIETYHTAPLDIKPGKTAATKINDYLWVHSYEHESTLSLRLGRVLGVELSEVTFDPQELMADWKDKDPTWNVPREW